MRERAIEHLDRAAQRARDDYANEAALLYLDRALGLQTRWQWLADQVSLFHLLGRRDDEQATLERLTAQADAPPLRLALAWSEYYETTSEYDQAVEQLEQAREIAAREHDHAGHAHCLAQLGLIAWKQGKSETAETHYRSALALLAEEAAFQR